MLLFSPSRVYIPLVLFLQFVQSQSEESEQYLKNVISSLNGNKDNGDVVRVQKYPIQTRRDDVNVEFHPTADVPMLSLSKDELATIYKNAVTNGKTVNLQTPNNNQPIKAVVHELDTSESHNYPVKTGYNSDGSENSYYYYYYPIKSFIDNLSHSSEETPYEHYEVTKSPLTQFHSHTHQHNVRITEVKEMADKKKMMHPLFMAISGFLGMAAMFILSAFVLPKFGIKKSAKQRNSVKYFGLGTDVILKAIEGDDCSERIRCEIGTVFHRTKIHENRFIKLFRRIVPSFISTQMNKVKKFIDKKTDCSIIVCKKSNSKPKSKKKSLKMLL